LDEISIAGATFIAELNDGSISEYEIVPEDFGIKRQPLVGLSVSNAAESLALIKSALGNEPGELAQKAQDIIALNSGAAIYACGLADTLKEGVVRAQDAIGSGLAKEKLTELVAFTGVFSD
jgi:anthranilate phosphoribosyltransferase